MKKQNFIKKHLLSRSILSYLLYPLSFIFSIILILRRLISNYSDKYKPNVYVISIGNITAGGSGKTPFTIFLAKYFQSKGVKIAVSHRGYKSSFEDTIQLISDTKGLFKCADKSGDEAWLLATELQGIPVVVGKNRKLGIYLLKKVFPDIECVILDDSFQHLEVQHDFDIVIVNEYQGFGNGFVLPAGYLREPVSTLINSNLLIWNYYTKAPWDKNSIYKKICSFDIPVLSGTIRPTEIRDFYNNNLSFTEIYNYRYLLVSGIGNPQAFIDTARELKLQIITIFSFPDHFDYKNKNIRKSIIKKMNLVKAEKILTTQKDYAKLRLFPEFESILHVLIVSFHLDENQEAYFYNLMKCIKEKQERT